MMTARTISKTTVLPSPKFGENRKIRRKTIEAGVDTIDQAIEDLAKLYFDSKRILRKRGRKRTRSKKFKRLGTQNRIQSSMQNRKRVFGNVIK